MQSENFVKIKFFAQVVYYIINKFIIIYLFFIVFKKFSNLFLIKHISTVLWYDIQFF